MTVNTLRMPLVETARNKERREHSPSSQHVVSLQSCPMPHDTPSPSAIGAKPSGHRLALSSATYDPQVSSGTGQQDKTGILVVGVEKRVDVVRLFKDGPYKDGPRSSS